MNCNILFTKFAAKATKLTGSLWAFLGSVVIVLIWLGFGPFFQWNDSYNLFINSLTTIITFWMVFLIQNAQNRDNKALHLKLDELIKSADKADDQLQGIEEMTEQEMGELKQKRNP